jgi:FkbM family methyltransferase
VALLRIAARVLRAVPSRWVERLGAFQRRSPQGQRLVAVLTGPMRRRDLRVLGGHAAGLRINLGGSALAYLTGRAEPNVQETLVSVLRPGDVVYDVGANVGFFTMLCARLVGPEGRVYAFEPMPANAAALRHNLALNGLDNVEVVEAAASDVNGTATLLVSRWSAFHRLEGEGFRSRTWQDETTLEVRTMRLDEFATRPGVRPPRLVKMDVEGAEPEVIHGLEGLLTGEAKPLVLCELHGENPRYVKLLASLGYGVRSVDGPEPVETAHYNVHTLAEPTASAAAE